MVFSSAGFGPALSRRPRYWRAPFASKPNMSGVQMAS